MEVQMAQQTLKAEEQPKTNSSYLRIRELTKEDLEKFPTLPFTLSRRAFEKTGSVNYFIRFELPCLEIQDSIKQSKFFAIRIAYKNYDNSSVLRKACRYRIIKGFTKDDKPFYQIQLIFDLKTSYTHLLSDVDVNNLVLANRHLGKEVDFINKPKEIDEVFDEDSAPLI